MCSATGGSVIAVSVNGGIHFEGIYIMMSATISSHTRGWKIVWDEKRQEWFYVDTGESADIERKCKRCSKFPTPEGYDACLGYIKGVESACCGHGVLQAFYLKNKE